MKFLISFLITLSIFLYSHAEAKCRMERVLITSTDVLCGYNIPELEKATMACLDDDSWTAIFTDKNGKSLMEVKGVFTALADGGSYYWYADDDYEVWAGTPKKLVFVNDEKPCYLLLRWEYDHSSAKKVYNLCSYFKDGKITEERCKIQ